MASEAEDKNQNDDGAGASESPIFDEGNPGEPTFEEAKEDFLFMLDLLNKSYNSGKMDKDTFNDRLYRMLETLEKKGVYTPKEIREIETANIK